MVKKIIVAALIFSLTLFLFPTANAGAASGLVINEKDGKSYVSGYSGNGGAVTVPAGIDYIAGNAFKDNIKITSVTVPDGCAVNKNAFENCAGLESVTFEGSVPHIGDEAFLNCTSLKELTFKKQTAKLGYIGKSAFKNCFELDEISFPENIGEIREFAFGNCVSLEDVKIPKKISSIDKNALGFMYDEKTDSYFPADGRTAASVRYYQAYKGKLLEWYSEQVGKALTINAVKDSQGEAYAVGNDIKYVLYKAVEIPDVAAEAGTDSVVLKWNKIKDAAAYRVSILEDGKYSEYKTTSGKICTVKGLEPGTEYTFKVSVLEKIKANKFSVLVSSDEITVSTKAAEKKIEEDDSELGAPVVTAEAAADSVVLNWKKVKNADAYRVYIYNSAEGKYKEYKIARGKSCTVTGLQSGTEYKFMVVSLKRVKSKYETGGSAEVTISTGDVVRS